MEFIVFLIGLILSIVLGVLLVKQLHKNNK